MPRTDPYSHGHAPSVVGHHALRTAEDSAAFLLPHLKAGMSLLDVGCGPGSVTADLAERVHPGRVLAIDVAPIAVESTRALAAERRLDNLEAAVGNVYDLPSERFDVVYAHQVLQHLAEPVQALAHMRESLTGDGIVAVRDSDYAGMIWAPRLPELDRWVDLYHEINAALGLEADSGRWLPAWVAAAGFTTMNVTSSTWTHSTLDARAVWGGAWAQRVVESSYAEHAVRLGLSDDTELRSISAAFRSWASEEHAMWVVPHVEVIASA